MKVFIAIFAYFACAQASVILSTPLVGYTEPAKLVVPVQQQTTQIVQSIPVKHTIQTIHAAPIRTIPVRTVKKIQTVQTIPVQTVKKIQTVQTIPIQTVKNIHTIPVQTVKTIRTVPAAIQRIQTLRTIPIQTIPVQTYKTFRNVPVQQNYVISSNGILKK